MNHHSSDILEYNIDNQTHKHVTTIIIQYFLKICK